MVACYSFSLYKWNFLEMEIKDRYVVFNFLKIYLITSCGFLLLFLIIQVIDNLTNFLRYGQEFNLKFYILQMPRIFVQISPIITLLTMLFLLSEMLKYREIKVFEISGISPFKIYKILLLLCFFLSLLIFYINSQIVPLSLCRTEKVSLLKRVNFSSSELTLYSEKVILPNYFEDIYLSQKIKNEKVIIVKAKKGWCYGNILRLFDGKYWIFDRGVMIEEKSFSQYILRSLLPPETIIKSLKFAEQLTLLELKETISKLQKVGVSPISLKANFQERIAYPFLNFFIILVSIHFFILRGKLTRFFVISFTFLLSFTCYLIYSAGLALAKEGKLPVWMGVWLVHILIFLSLGIPFIRLKIIRKLCIM